MPALPFSPEPLAALKARWPQALENVYYVSARLERGEEVPADELPSRQREHVFDFPSGLRIIASRDEIHGQVRLHVSASFFAGPPAGCDVEGEIAESLYELGGIRLPDAIMRVVTGGGIPHWMFPDPCEDAVG